MRLTPRAALVGSVMAIACLLTVGAAGAAAKAKSKPKQATTVAQERRQNNGLKALAAGLKTTNTNATKLTATVTGIDTTLKALQSTVSSTVSTAATALGQLKTGLEDLGKAVSDTTTGLPGLNNARPLIGAVVSDAAVTGSEFTVKHAPGAYVLSFVNGVGTATDVSKRVYEVTSANPTQATSHFSAVNCSNAAVTATCTAVNGSADAKPTDVLVVTSDASDDFQIAAISG